MRYDAAKKNLRNGYDFDTYTRKLSFRVSTKKKSRAMFLHIKSKFDMFDIPIYRRIDSDIPKVRSIFRYIEVKFDISKVSSIFRCVKSEFDIPMYQK